MPSHQRNQDLLTSPVLPAHPPPIFPPTLLVSMLLKTARLTPRRKTTARLLTITPIPKLHPLLEKPGLNSSTGYTVNILQIPGTVLSTSTASALSDLLEPAIFGLTPNTKSAHMLRTSTETSPQVQLPTSTPPLRMLTTTGLSLPLALLSLASHRTTSVILSLMLKV